MKQKPNSERCAAGERRTKCRSGRRATDNQQERERRLTQIVEFLRQETPELEFDREIGRLHRSNMRKARSKFFQ